jgi:hypothetical protein
MRAGVPRRPRRRNSVSLSPLLPMVALPLSCPMKLVQPVSIWYARLRGRYRLLAGLHIC